MNSLNGRPPKPGTDHCGTCGRKDLKCRVGGTGKKVMPFHRALCGKACIGGPVAREERIELGIHDMYCLCREKAGAGG
ncbi:MAG: hypothetical protein M3547_01035 [Acidobacteriota bacterium]|nr:hypothetical protein [Acidobacteriota bacterium]